MRIHPNKNKKVLTGILFNKRGSDWLLLRSSMWLVGASGCVDYITSKRSSILRKTNTSCLATELPVWGVRRQGTSCRHCLPPHQEPSIALLLGTHASRRKARDANSESAMWCERRRSGVSVRRTSLQSHRLTKLNFTGRHVYFLLWLSSSLSPSSGLTWFWLGTVVCVQNSSV